MLTLQISRGSSGNKLKMTLGLPVYVSPSSHGSNHDPRLTPPENYSQDKFTIND